MCSAKYDPCLHVVLFQPEIPQNTGNIGRTCVAIGAKLWLVRPIGFQLDDYYLRRAGLDYWEHLEFEVLDDWNAAQACVIEPSGRRPWLFTKSAPQSYTQVKFQHADVLVFGNESHGLPDWLHEQYSASRLRIPSRPEVRSLNLSNAVAVVAYEAIRQGIGGNGILD
jgi:tRNA (cytidine/uridine-2'-O-)-methyltransferase